MNKRGSLNVIGSKNREGGGMRAEARCEIKMRRVLISRRSGESRCSHASGWLSRLQSLSKAHCIAFLTSIGHTWPQGYSGCTLVVVLTLKNCFTETLLV